MESIYLENKSELTSANAYTHINTNTNANTVCHQMSAHSSALCNAQSLFIDREWK